MEALRKKFEEADMDDEPGLDEDEFIAAFGQGMCICVFV
jgi:hypothetical protein